MKANSPTLIKLLVLLCRSVLSVSQDFDFFYFVQQWPGSYCDTMTSCCYPTTGKPAADFGIHGLWPNYNDGTYPKNCDASSPYDPKKVADLRSGMQKNWPTLACPSGTGVAFWTHEWEKHGTCSESILDQHGYFQAALDLKKQVNLLQALTNAGINPDGGSYSLSSIKSAIQEAVGFTPWIECNTDTSRNSQLYQIYMCVDTSGKNVIDCPVFPRGKYLRLDKQFAEGYWPSLSCPSSEGFRFWSHEWIKHGTCAVSEEIGQHVYFEAALKLKKKANLLQALISAGIKPDGESYDLDSIRLAKIEATGFTPDIECNTDASKNRQVYQVFMCADISGSEFIECPVPPKKRCKSNKVHFPEF